MVPFWDHNFDNHPYGRRAEKRRLLRTSPGQQRKMGLNPLQAFPLYPSLPRVFWRKPATWFIHHEPMKPRRALPKRRARQLNPRHDGQGGSVCFERGLAGASQFGAHRAVVLCSRYRCCRPSTSF